MRNYYFLLPLCLFLACTSPSETEKAEVHTPEDTTSIAGETDNDKSFSRRAEEVFTLSEVTETEYRRVAAKGDTLKFPGLYVGCTGETRAETDACADQEEERLMELTGGEVQRHFDNLVFYFNRKKLEYKSVTHDDAGERYVEYRYQGVLSPFGIHVVEIGYYEEMAKLLLDPLTEKEHYTYGLPVASPSGKRIICANVDLIAGYSINGIQLFEYDTEKGLLLRWQVELEAYGLAEIAWETETTFLARKDFYLGGGDFETTFVRVTLR